MKKLMYVAVFAMALGMTSCGEDDVVDLVTDAACDAARPALRETVQTAIDAYNADTSSTSLCEAARTAIETYKSNECGDTVYDETLAARFFYQIYIYRKMITISTGIGSVSKTSIWISFVSPSRIS